MMHNFLQFPPCALFAEICTNKKYKVVWKIKIKKDLKMY